MQKDWQKWVVSFSVRLSLHQNWMQRVWKKQTGAEAAFFFSPGAAKWQTGHVGLQRHGSPQLGGERVTHLVDWLYK